MWYASDVVDLLFQVYISGESGTLQPEWPPSRSTEAGGLKVRIGSESNTLAPGAPPVEMTVEPQTSFLEAEAEAVSHSGFLSVDGEFTGKRRDSWIQPAPHGTLEVNLAVREWGVPTGTYNTRLTRGMPIRDGAEPNLSLMPTDASKLRGYDVAEGDVLGQTFTKEERFWTPESDGDLYFRVFVGTEPAAAPPGSNAELTRLSVTGGERREDLEAHPDWPGTPDLIAEVPPKQLLAKVLAEPADPGVRVQIYSREPIPFPLQNPLMTVRGGTRLLVMVTAEDGITSRVYELDIDRQDDPAAPIDLIVNGTVLSGDVTPQLVEGVPFVPLRAVFEALGGTVGYTAETRTVIAKIGDQMLSCNVGDSRLLVNGRAMALPAPLPAVQGRLLTPLSILEAMDVHGYYDEEIRLISLRRARR